MATLYSNLADVRLAETLSAELQVLLADRASLFGHPSIIYAGDAAQSGSSTIKVPIAGLNGYDRMAPIAAGTAATDTAFTDDSVTITIARQALQRQLSSLADLTDSVGVNTSAFVADMFGAAMMRFQELLVNVTDDFTSTVGTTTVAMTVTDFYSAQFTLTQASASGRPLCVLYPKQLTDFQSSLRSESGPAQYKIAAQDMLDIKGQGISGEFNGVDIAVSSLVPTATAGADSAGGMWVRGAVAYADGTARPTPIGPVVYPAGTKLFIEIDRDLSYDYTKIVGNWFVGVVKAQDGAGVSIITDR